MSLFAELKRRNVFRMGILYLVSSWLILQVADVLAGLFGLPDWSMRFVGFVLLLGFPLALIFSWIYELTPEGIKREAEVKRDDSITSATAKRMDLITIGIVVLGVGFVLGERFLFPENRQSVETPSGAYGGDRTASRSVPGRGGIAVQKSVAVLPFSNLSDDPQQVYFVDGLAEEILNRLAHIPGLLVTARTSSFQFRDTQLGIPEIADKLGVAHVVEGSVRRFGDQLRVTTQLIRAVDGFHVWSENYDREINDLFEIQDDIAQKIANALDVFLDEQQRREIQKVGTRNVEAFELWSRAIPHFDNYHTNDDRSGLLKASRLLSEAIELDPTFSAAYLFRSDLYAHFLFGDQVRLPGNHPEGLTDDEAYRLLQHDLEQAERHAVDDYAKTLTRIDRLFLSSDWNELPVAFNRLDELLAADDRPPGLNQWGDVVTATTGRTEMAVELTLRNVKRNPLSRFPYAEAVGALGMHGNMANALALIEQAREQTGDHPFFGSLEAKVHYFRQDPQATLDALSRYNEKGSTEFFRVWAAASLGRCDEARASFEDYLESSQGEDSFTLAWALAWMGEMESAAEQVERSDPSPVAAARFSRAAWNFGPETPWDPSLMPNITRQFKDAGKELKQDQDFMPLCPGTSK